MPNVELCIYYVNFIKKLIPEHSLAGDLPSYKQGDGIIGEFNYLFNTFRYLINVLL